MLSITHVSFTWSLFGVKQFTGSIQETGLIGTTTESVPVHPKASVISTEYRVFDKDSFSAFDVPFDHK